MVEKRMASDSQQFQPPGTNRRPGRSQLKGRQIDAVSQAEVRKLIGLGPHKRETLIELLHALQDEFGALHTGHLLALAGEMRLAPVEVYEVASFYHSFVICDESYDNDLPIRPCLKICGSLTCANAGSNALMTSLQDIFGKEADIVSVACLGRCERAPVANIGHNFYSKVSQAELIKGINGELSSNDQMKPITHGEYEASGGYQLYRDCLSNKKTPDSLIASLQETGLRGLGGAGFPTGLKWQLVRAADGEKLMAVNGDESEPGTFKDRHYLETDPHRFIEGMLIAAWAVDAKKIYLYIRDEYPHLRQLLAEELESLRQSGLQMPPIEIRRGAGAYICGEESAMLESLEGKRGLPRHKPPFPSEVGLFGQPTLINNIETLYWIREMIERGGEWFKSHGRNGKTGLRSFSVSGPVVEPGVKLAPAGITVAELVEEYCGGMVPGKKLTAYLPGGASGGIFPASMSDIPLDFGTFEEFGGLIGSAAIIILSKEHLITDAVRNLTEFFEDESCGQCTPCRLGTEKSAKLMAAGNWDKTLLSELADVMADASICGLGQAAANPIRCALKYFSEDLQ